MLSINRNLWKLLLEFPFCILPLNIPKKEVFSNIKVYVWNHVLPIIMVISISLHYAQHTIRRGVWKRHEAALFDVDMFFLFALNYTRQAHFVRHSCDLITLKVYREFSIKIVTLIREKRSDIYCDDIVISRPQIDYINHKGICSMQGGCDRW